MWHSLVPIKSPFSAWSLYFGSKISSFASFSMTARSSAISAESFLKELGELGFTCDKKADYSIADIARKWQEKQF